MTSDLKVGIVGAPRGAEDYTVRKIASFLFRFARSRLRLVKRFALYHGLGRLRGDKRWCPICGRSSRRFLPYGVRPREDAACPHCGALERHRLAWLYIERKTDLFDGRPKRTLHVAPERCLEEPLARLLGDAYVTADLNDPRAMVKMDVSDIQFPDAFFAVVFCSHVLEHVPDDKRAMREFRRILAPGGWAVFFVPVSAPETVEDPSIVDPKERLRAFGQADHVRRYGPDFADRLRKAGFDVAIVRAADLCNARQARRTGIARPGTEFYYVVKRGGASSCRGPHTRRQKSRPR